MVVARDDPKPVSARYVEKGKQLEATAQSRNIMLLSLEIRIEFVSLH